MMELVNLAAYVPCKYFTILGLIESNGKFAQEFLKITDQFHFILSVFFCPICILTILLHEQIFISGQP